MYVLIALLGVLFAILLLPVGAVGGYDFGKVELKLIIGPIKIRILPLKPETPMPEILSDKMKENIRKQLPELTLEQIKDYVSLATRALRRFRHKLSVRRLRLYYLAAAKDPYYAAINYGAANAVVANILVMLHAALKIKEQDVRLRVDFLEPREQISIGAEATIRIWEIIYIGVCALIEYLKLRSKHRDLKKQTEERNDGNGEASNRRSDGDHDVKDKGNGGRQHHSGDAYNNA